MLRPLRGDPRQERFDQDTRALGRSPATQGSDPGEPDVVARQSFGDARLRGGDALIGSRPLSGGANRYAYVVRPLDVTNSSRRC